MRNLLCLVVFFVMQVMPFALFAAKNGDTFTNGYFKYIVLSAAEKQVGVQFYSSTATSATVPATVSSGGTTYTVVSIESFAFSDSDIQKVSLPNTLESIKLCAFKGSGLKTITIPASTTAIGQGVFDQCQSLTSITVHQNNPSLCSVDGVLFGKDKWYLIKYPEAKTGKTYEIPTSVEMIFDYAFGYNKYLEEVTIPESVTDLGYNTFESAASLKAITIPNSVTTIEESTFKNCKKLSKLIIGEKVSSITDGVFYGCSGLTGIVTLNPEPASLDADVFTGVSLSTPVYVPYKSSAKYKQAAVWKKFTNISEMGTIEMSLIGNNISIGVGESLNVVRGTVVTGNIKISEVEWSSSNTNVAIIEKNGVVKGVAPGTSVISWLVIDNYDCTHLKQCTVTVENPSELRATSLKDLLGKANPDGSNEVIVDFPLTVTYVNGKDCYVIDAEGSTSQIYTALYKERDVIPQGWTASLHKYSASEFIYPKSGLKTSSNKGSFILSEYELWETPNMQLNEVAIIKNVVFPEVTPTDGEYYKASDGETSTWFKNYYNISSQPAGTYNVKAVLASDFTSTKYLYPIAYYPAGDGFNYDDYIYVIRSCNDYDISDDSKKLYARTEGGVKTYEGFVEFGSGPQYFMFMTELNNASSVYGFTDKWKENETYRENGISIQKFSDGTLQRGATKTIGWSNFPQNLGGVFFIVNLNNGSLVIRMGDTNYADIEPVVSDDGQGEEVFYNLQGVRVDKPENGIYIRVKGSVREKVLIK